MLNLLIVFVITPIVLGVIAFSFQPSLINFFYGYVTAEAMIVLFGLIDGEMEEDTPETDNDEK